MKYYPCYKMSLQVFTGPMFSGKTQTLLRKINKFIDISGKKGLIINHSLDNRDIKGIISSHSSMYKGVVICNTDIISNDKLSTIDVSEYNMIGIDEINFFNDEYDLVNTIKLWINLGKHVICSGLDGDANMNQFGYISKLLPIADKFVKLNAKCEICKNEMIHIDPINLTDAPFTKKLYRDINDVNIVDVGGSDKYIAVCRKHFNV